MTLDEALNKIIDLENDKKELNKTIDSLNIQVDTIKGNEEKLTKDVERLQKHNMDLFLKISADNDKIVDNIDDPLKHDDVVVKSIDELLQEI